MTQLTDETLAMLSIFQALDLPVERDSLSSGSGSGTGSHHQYPPPAHLHRMYFRLDYNIYSINKS